MKPLILALALSAVAHAGRIDLATVWCSGPTCYKFIDFDGNAETLSGVPVSGLTVGFNPLIFDDGGEPPMTPPSSELTPLPDPTPILHDPLPPVVAPLSVPAEVPEPATFALVGLALVVLAMISGAVK